MSFTHILIFSACSVAVGWAPDASNLDREQGHVDSHYRSVDGAPLRSHDPQPPVAPRRTQAAPASVVITPATAPAAEAGTQSQDDWKTWLDAKAASFSGAVLVARGDTVQIASAYGLADRTAGRRNTPETRFNLGSINKTFTAVAARS